jgi:trehalose 6-phosphate synthase
MARLVVVCNRVNPPADRGGGTLGGVAVALSAALRAEGGIWFGWSGNTARAFTGEVAEHVQDGIRFATMDLDRADAEEYLTGYANRAIWPFFHYAPTPYAGDSAERYQAFNARFAEALHPLLRPDDLIWVHDYHLIPLGAALRRRGVTNRIGFFLHIPWPPRELLLGLPGHERLVEALFAYDVAGFHTDDWRDAFGAFVARDARGSVTAEGHATAFGRSLRIGTFPVGVDVAEFAAATRSAKAIAAHRKLADSLNGRQLAIGVDRLDYPKGLEERFLAFEQCLVQHPELKERVRLLQIAPPSREAVGTYDEIRARLEALAGRINGRFAGLDWAPIQFLNRMHRRDELAGSFRAARVGLVTPFRDGMNLVAKEYVAAQDPADPGVLVLSRFAGAAAQMKEALIVNPFARAEVCGALIEALAMEKSERIRRWESLMQGVVSADVTAWCNGFLTALRAA